MGEPVPESTPAAAKERQEQRAHPRFKVDGATVSLAKPGFLATLGVGVKKEAVVNLSQGGLLVKSRKLLPVGARLLLKIEIPKWQDLIACEGEVRWCAESARDAKSFYAGLRFAGLNPGDARRIEQMRELSRSAEYRAKSAARKDGSSGRLPPTRP
ncbi:MAG TPA: PilZ domain-containing protein [Planctomycetota bacterium]